MLQLIHLSFLSQTRTLQLNNNNNKFRSRQYFSSKMCWNDYYTYVLMWFTGMSKILMISIEYTIEKNRQWCNVYILIAFEQCNNRFMKIIQHIFFISILFFRSSSNTIWWSATVYRIFGAGRVRSRWMLESSCMPISWCSSTISKSSYGSHQRHRNVWQELFQLNHKLFIHIKPIGACNQQRNWRSTVRYHLPLSFMIFLSTKMIDLLIFFDILPTGGIPEKLH